VWHRCINSTLGPAFVRADTLAFPEGMRFRSEAARWHDDQNASGFSGGFG